MRVPVLVLLLYVAVATAVGHVDYRIRDNRQLGFTKYVPEVLAGIESPPAKYRLLSPTLYDELRQLTGLEPEEAWVVWEWLCVFAALLAMHYYLRTWFDTGPSVAGVLLVAALLPLTFTNSWPYPDQLMELFLFALGCACIARQHNAAFLVVLVVAALNRETSAFLVLLFVLAHPFERRQLGWVAVAGLLWGGTYAGLRAWLGFVPYQPWNLPGNLVVLKVLGEGFDPYKRAFAWFGVVLLLPLAWSAMTAWGRLPRMAGMAAAVVTPLFVVTCLLFSSIIETRIFTPVLPLLAPAVLFALFTSRPGAKPASLDNAAPVRLTGTRSADAE